MKKSAILGIFNGARGHIESMPRPKPHKNGETVCAAHDELKEKLNPELFALHEKLFDALESDYNDEIDFYFVEGFKLGLLIGIECVEE